MKLSWEETRALLRWALNERVRLRRELEPLYEKRKQLQAELNKATGHDRNQKTNHS